ncbi:hypothetical protein C8R47DRAFT_1161110 [Mycena vitilis]|nr:hypothetical protein C8R47DRAFT_1161110 [Mycena vitilis]
MSLLLELSPELHLSIISLLALEDKARLRLVSKLFDNLLLIEVAFQQLLRTAHQKQSILLVKNAVSGQLGFKPFLITGVQKTSEDEGQRILLDIYYPKYMCNNEESSEDEDNGTEGDWEIYIHMQELSMDTDKAMSDARRVKSVEYDDALRGNLVRASAGMMRTRFTCPECGNSRSVCPGCGGFSGRFEGLFTSCGWSMPCPVCIGYGVAEDAKYIQDDEEELDALWKEIDAMLVEDTKSKK